MRNFMGVTLTALVLVASMGRAPADDADKARAVIDKGIKVLGGADNLAKFNVHTWKEKGTYYGMGDGLPYTGVYAIQWPDQFRMEIENVFIVVLNGDKGWIKAQGEVKEMSAKEIAEQKENHYGGWVTTLLPLKDKAYKLALIDEIMVDKRPAVGVKVSHKDHRDVKVYFDKETGLRVKAELRVHDESGKEVTQEMFYRDYKEIEGAKVPMKIEIKRDGKRFVEAENLDVKPAGKLEAKVFEKP